MLPTARSEPGLARALVLIALLGGCAPATVTGLRFENRALVVRVRDRAPAPRPRETESGELSAYVHGMLREPLLHAMALHGAHFAENINSAGEVPDSTWFENRIGVRELDAAEVARGPCMGGPDRSAPLRVVKDKTGGAPGFVVEDARGDRYILKFDPSEPELESGAEAVLSRLLWAAGYHVPDNEVVFLAPEELELAPGATHKLPSGERVRLVDADLQRMLARAPRALDGRLRALASRYLPGVPVGGYPGSGVRRDDPNDRVPHEHRRDVRGQAVFFSWLGHTDIKQDNTLDTWIESPEGSGRGYLMHHVLDFGKGLGGWAVDGLHEHDGFSPHFDYAYASASLVSLGLWKRPWEDIEVPELPGLGRFETVHYRPELYAPANPYEPFLYLDRFDAYWAAKIIAHFRREHVEAAVAAGRYSDPRTRRYLVRTLLERQRKLVRHFFSLVSPIDDFSVEPVAQGVRVCARDLLVALGFGRAEGSSYRVRAHDWTGRALAWPETPVRTADGRLCASGAVRDGRDGYTMVGFSVRRPEAHVPDVIVHVARDPESRAPRVIGVERR